MPRFNVDDYLVDASWDGNYFCIHKDSFDAGFQPTNNNDDMRSFLRALLFAVNEVNSMVPAAGKSKEMTITRTSSVAAGNKLNIPDTGTLTDSYSLRFTALVPTVGDTYNVKKEPFKVVIQSLADQANGYATVTVEPISGGDWEVDYIDSIGFVASKTVRTPTYDTDFDWDDGADVYGDFDTIAFTLDGLYAGIGLYYVTPWIYAYDIKLDRMTYYYGPTQSVRVTGSCFLQGTKITLADGSKKNVEELTYDDNLLVWNFDEGRADVAKPVWLSVAQPNDKYSKITFADGTVLDSTSPALGHRIYSVDSNSFISPMPRSVASGTVTLREDGSNTTLVSKEMVKATEDLNFYGVLTDTHMNCYANGILTSYPMNNLYPISGMKYVKDDRSPRVSGEFPSEVSSEMFAGLRLSEQPRADDLNAKLRHMTRDQKPKA